MSILHRIRWFRVLSALTALSVAGWWTFSPCDSQSTCAFSEDAAIMRPDLKLMVNRIWIDHLPKGERDMVSYLAFLDRNKQRIGVISRASRWRVVQEGFRWQTARSEDPGTVMLTFPQNNRRLKLKTRAYECAGSAPEPFELCLDVTTFGRTGRLYSMKEWVIDALPATPDDLPVIEVPAQMDNTVLDDGVFEMLTID